MNFSQIFQAFKTSSRLQQKLLWTIWLLALYRFLVVIPVPFVDIDMLMAPNGATMDSLWFFVMLLGWSLENFSLVAVGLSPFINASIIFQLLTFVIPHLEELQEMGEQGTKQIQQYTRYATFPLAFLQWIGMVYFINSLLGGQIIDTSSFTTVFLAAFVLAVGSMMMVFLADVLTEKWLSNGTSMLIFASIVAWITNAIYGSFVGATWVTDVFKIVLFIVIVLCSLVVFSIFLLKSQKKIPIIYARAGKVEQTTVLPIPLNPVGMVPIIFAIAFATFPYLLAQLVIRLGTMNQSVLSLAQRVEINLNIYSTQNPSMIAIAVYFVLIVAFTFFYTLIQYNPEKIADSIQKKWGFIYGIRPWKETAKYIHTILMHLCVWWWLGLGFLWIYGYIIYSIPFIGELAQLAWNIPVAISGSWIIIVVGVVQEIFTKLQSEHVMEQYESIS